MKDNYNKYKGYVIITNKTTKEITTFKNVVCDKFYELIADFFAGNNPDIISHLGIGTGTNTAVSTDTTLQTEVARVSITFSSASGNQIQVQTEVDGSTAVTTWKELGLFNAITSGDMTNRTNVDYVHNAGEIVTIDWYIEKA